MARPGERRAPDFESLVDEIKSVVKPESWGDDKKLVPMRENLLLAVTNSAEAHAEIQDLLSIHREAINNEQWFVQQNICKYCRATPMPSGVLLVPIAAQCDVYRGLRPRVLRYCPEPTM